MSEDVLKDGKKFYESGLPVDGSQDFTYTQWGKIPTQTTQTYAFATTKGARAMQDLGYNGLNDTEEQRFDSYQDFLKQIQGKVSQAVFDSIWAVSGSTYSGVINTSTTHKATRPTPTTAPRLTTRHTRAAPTWRT